MAVPDYTYLVQPGLESPLGTPLLSSPDVLYLDPGVPIWITLDPIGFGPSRRVLFGSSPGYLPGWPFLETF